VESESSVDLLPEIPETVVEILAEEGDSVSKGQVLARLDWSELALEVKRSEANLDRGEADLSQLLAGNRSEDIKVVQAARDRARSAYDNMVLNKERYQALHERKIFTDKDWDDFLAQLNQAKESLAAADAELEKARRGPRREEIERARAAVAGASAELALSKQRLTYTEIRAPFAGVVAKRFLELGEKLDTAKPAFSIYDDRSLRVNVSVPEMDIGWVTKGQKCIVTATAFPQETYEGVVDIVGERLDVATRTLPTRILLATGYDKLLPGMFAQVVIEAGNMENAVVIARDTMRLREGRPTAFVLEDGRARERVLQLGQADAEKVHVTIGLKIGEQLIVSDTSDLIDNQEVRTEQATSGEAG